MATPKKRKSLTRRRCSRAHDKIYLPNIVKCSECNVKKLQHHVCLECGVYNQSKIFTQNIEEVKTFGKRVEEVKILG